MGFKTSDHIKGKIFIPAKTPIHLKKHPCKDCFSCQMCGDARCGLCREEKRENPDKSTGQPIADSKES